MAKAYLRLQHPRWGLIQESKLTLVDRGRSKVFGTDRQEALSVHEIARAIVDEVLHFIG